MKARAGIHLPALHISILHSWEAADDGLDYNPTNFLHQHRIFMVFEDRSNETFVALVLVVVVDFEILVCLVYGVVGQMAEIVVQVALAGLLEL